MMTTNKLLILIAVLIFSRLFSQGLPSCVITAPHSNAYFQVGNAITFRVYATDIGSSSGNGTITRVEFFNGLTKIGEATTHTNNTYTLVWNCSSVGTHILRARATDNSGNVSNSAGVKIVVGTTPPVARGMSANKGKYLGNIIAGSIPQNYNTFWNAVTSENDNKWGSVEPQRNQMNWTGSDRAFNHAKNNNLAFRYHALAWGNQYPCWAIRGQGCSGGSNNTGTPTLQITQQEFRDELEQYMQLVAQRYGDDIDQLDVLNENLQFGDGSEHAPATPVFRQALGGSGTTGYDWVVWLFEKARQYFPNSKLVLNDYGLENDQSAINRQLAVIRVLRDRNLIDGFGTQAHEFNVNTLSASALTNALNLMANSGVPIYVTELDISGNDSEQNTRYQTLFPVYWNHAAVAGISLWGYIQNQTWIANTHLMSSGANDATFRPAMTWLQNYMQQRPNVGYPFANQTGGGTCNQAPTVSLTAPANNAVFSPGTNISLTATASDVDGTVSRVEFFNGATKLGEDLTSPYSFVWNNVAEGLYTLTARATDNSGNMSTSVAVNIRVGNPVINIIENGEFNNGTTGWSVQNNSGATSTFQVVTNGNLSGNNAGRVCPTNPGTADWHVQLRTAAPLELGKSYNISFLARADAARTMSVALQQEGGDFAFHFGQQVSLTTTAQTFSIDYTSTVNDPSALLKFFLGNNASCVFIDRVVMTEIFPPVATIEVTGNTTVCAGTNVLLTANAGTNLTYQWRRNGTNITGATGLTYEANQTGAYTVEVTRAGMSTISTAVNITVNANPTAPTVTSPVNYCQGATATALTATGTNLKWYTAQTGGTASTTAPTPSTTTVGTTNFFVSQTNANNCESPRATIAVTVNPNPTAPTVTTPVNYCQGSTATSLTATGTNLKWYTAQTGGTASTTAPTPSTTTVGTTIFFVSQTNA
ncbi:MAG: endo-1,4-beta-xylanase, partial [Cytophagales bacterium]